MSEPGEPIQPARRKRWRRVLVGVLSGMVALALLAVGGIYLLYRHYDGQITRVGIRLTEPPPTAGQTVASPPPSPSPTPDRSANFVLMGSDSRDFAGGQAFNVSPDSPAYVTGQRSDVVMLLHVPADGSAPTVVSFPRDSWVELPAYVDDKGRTHKAVWAKLNAAFALGGASLLVATIEHLTSLHVDHFAAVNFEGFQGMVNALGGVDVCIGTTRHEPNSGDFLTAGHHHINGKQALALVRDRESFANQDLGRIKDQEYFLSVMIHKAMSIGTLTNPLKLNAFLNVATKSLTVDKGFSLGDMRELASRFSHLDPSHVHFETVPVGNANYQVKSSLYGDQTQSAVQIDEAAAARLFNSLGGHVAVSPSASASSSGVDESPTTGPSTNGSSEPSLSPAPACAL